jgi:3-oxoacyl-(acyl-carrier-protein) synthase
MSSQELVITAVGAVGAFGGSAADFWSALTRGAALAAPSQTLPHNALSTEMIGFDLACHRHTANGSRRPRTSQYALAAASQAISQARLDTMSSTEKDEVAIIYGTGTGPIALSELTLEATTVHGLGALEPLWFQESVINAPASLIGIEYGFRGPLLALPMGWAAGGYAVTSAADLLSFGSADVVLIVVSDELAPLAYNAYRALGMVSPNNGKDAYVRPFDLRHNGAILGDGAAAIVLETRNHAERRGVSPLAKLSGWSSPSDSFGIGPKSRGADSIGLAMTAAMAQSGRTEVDVIYSGSYCTADADRAEAAAIKGSFRNVGAPAVTNIRGTVGEIRGTTGLLNVIAACASLHTGVIPPTAGFESPDPLCDIDVVRTARSGKLASAMCNAFWTNGVNASLLMEACV